MFDRVREYRNFWVDLRNQPVDLDMSLLSHLSFDFLSKMNNLCLYILHLGTAVDEGPFRQNWL